MNPSFYVEEMNNMNDVLEQRLDAKKRDLEKQQEYFRIDMKTLNNQIMKIMLLMHYYT